MRTQKAIHAQTGRRVLIAGFCGSPRPAGNTAILVKKVIEGFTEAVESESRYFNLHFQNIASCQSCYSCLRTGQCAIKDGMEPVYDAICHAGALVVGTPVYMEGPSAQLKLMLDRLHPFLHCNKKRPPIPRLPFVLVVSQGDPDTLKYKPLVESLAEALSNCFDFTPVETVLHYSGGTGRSINAGEDKKLLKKALDAGKKMAEKVAAEYHRKV